MKLAIMQPYFLPYIGYFQLINVVDKFIILDDVNFIKKGWVHRNKITLNDNDYLFTIPLIKASQNKLINEICIVQDAKWKINLLKTIKLSYFKSPFFLEVYNLMDTIINYNENKLSNFIVNSLNEIIKYLEIDTRIVESSSIFDKEGNKGEDRIISICNKNNADNYYNLIGGRELYNKQKFESHNLKLNFIKNIFENNSSILDILMNHSKSEIKFILNNYEIS